MKWANPILVLGALAAMAFGSARLYAQAAAPDSPRPVSQNPVLQKMLCVLLDLNAMSPAEQVKAQEAALHYIQDHFTQGNAAPSDLVEIATYTTKFSVIQDFTGDRDSLVAALKSLKPAQVDGDSGGRMEAIQAATASLATSQGNQAGLVYVTTPAGSPSYMAAASALRFAANPEQPIGVSLLPIQP